MCKGKKINYELGFLSGQFFVQQEHLFLPLIEFIMYLTKKNTVIKSIIPSAIHWKIIRKVLQF